MDRKQLKREARTLLTHHYGFFFVLFLPIFILTMLTAIFNAPWWHDQTVIWSGSDWMSLLCDILLSLLSVGIYFVLVDLFRGEATLNQPLTKSMTIFHNSQYVLGTIVISIIQFIFVMLWMVLLIVPGIIKSLAYSQAYFIYRDSVDQGRPITYLDAITQSRRLMDGHKLEYFVLSLSFIGWLLLVLITAGIAMIFVQPYLSLTMANFYHHLRDTPTTAN